MAWTRTSGWAMYRGYLLETLVYLTFPVIPWRSLGLELLLDHLVKQMTLKGDNHQAAVTAKKSQQYCRVFRLYPLLTVLSRLIQIDVFLESGLCVFLSLLCFHPHKFHLCSFWLTFQKNVYLEKWKHVFSGQIIQAISAKN